MPCEKSRCVFSGKSGLIDRLFKRRFGLIGLRPFSCQPADPALLWKRRMATVGEQLKAAREARRLTIRWIAEATRMRTDYVQAIEEGDYAKLGAPVYIRGFVRAYARALNLDANSIIAALEKELGWKRPERRRLEETKPAGPDLLEQWTARLQEVSWHVVSPIATGAFLALVAFLIVRGGGSSDAGALPPGVGEAYYQSPSATPALRAPLSMNPTPPEAP